ncbi:hypothetical protein D1BOALGB6SA_1343 [Olavius sp. associated proteobacterium Delta 1]|nr:hypothetical protein D1BOALGB6SA_1343 [Olavius sp. associated proteobacterium Delta 1]
MLLELKQQAFCKPEGTIFQGRFIKQETTMSNQFPIRFLIGTSISGDCAV